MGLEYKKKTNSNQENKMNIAIITHWWSKKNYGQILQAFALQEFLKEMGHSVQFIKYDAMRDVSEWNKRKSLIKYNLSVIKHKIDRIRVKFNDPRKFLIFKKKNLSFSILYNSYEKLCKNPPIADVYITGSDQVWGPWTRLEPYFLGFGKIETKRIAYAASFGRESLSEKEESIITPLLKKFRAVGVRELSATHICSKLMVPSTWVPDPTLLLSREKWLSISEKNYLIDEKRKNIFVYIIGRDITSEFKEAINILSKDDCNILCTSDSENELENSKLTLGEWIYCISKADYIITNSFHGTLFCLIFNKKFITIRRRGKNTDKMNTRLVSILGKVRLERKFVEIIDDSLIENINDSIDWHEVNNIIDEWTGEGKIFLNASINS